VADIIEAGENPAPPALNGQVAAQTAAEARQYSRTGDLIKAKMQDLVKGAGYINGNQPLADNGQILMKAHQATLDLRTETYRGYRDKPKVVKGLNGDFLNQFGYLKTALSAPSIMEQMQQLVGGLPGGPDALKSFTAGQLGGVSSVYGLVPFDLNGVLAS
jgi:hypothetical protein